MDLRNPMTPVIPGAYGDVLAVLARTDVALSGRRIASPTRGPTSRRRVDAVLAELAGAGVVLVREVGIDDRWDRQVDALRESVRAWSGNGVSR